ncbi:hypothetical protein E3P96_02595 [Wallemia ichthyophaga]|nr:hypothetical protein E3P96_02595 [Wallemia ichthyophaga]
MSSILNKYKKKENKEESTNNRHNLMVMNQPLSQYDDLPKLDMPDKQQPQLDDDTQTPTLERRSLPLSIGDGSLSLDEFNHKKSQSNSSLRSNNTRKRNYSDSNHIPDSLRDVSPSGHSTPDKSQISPSTRNSIDTSRNSLNETDSQIGLALNDRHSSDVDSQSLELNDYFGEGITGFAVASSRRNADFHQLFPNIPEQDYLIEDYGCALQREILIQGRLYISENHISFNANIFGWVTSFAVPFSEMVAIEKKMTAFVIPNAIQISTLRAKYVFASFLSRDTVYDVILNIWRLSHPTIPVSEESHESAHLINQGSSQEDSDTSAESSATSASTSLSKSSRKHKEKGGKQSRNARPSVPRQATQRPPPTIHRPTKIDPSVNFPEVAMDTTLPATPEKLYNLMFTSFFIKDFMSTQDLTEIQISDWQPKADSSKLSRTITYIKPLTVGVGPKSTKCVLDDENEHVDFDDHVLVLTSTRTPEVPSGNSFVVRTRTAISWATNNNSHVIVSTKVEWTGRSFLKGVIERSAIEGQKSYHRALESAMRKYIEEHANEFTDTNAITPEKAREEKEGSKELAEKAKVEDSHLKSTMEHTSMLPTILQHLLDGTFELFNKVVRLTMTIFSALGALTISPSFTKTLYVLILILIISNAYTYFNLTPFKPISTLSQNHEPLLVDTIRSVVHDAFKHHTHTQSNAQMEIDQLNVALDRIQNRLEIIKQSM